MWVRATKGPKQESNRLRLFMPDTECIYVIRVYPSKDFRVGFALIVRYIIYNFIWWFASYLWNVGRFSPRTLDSSTKCCEILLTVALNSNNNPIRYLYCLYNKMTRLIIPFRIYWRKRRSEYHHRIVHISITMGVIIGNEFILGCSWPLSCSIFCLLYSVLWTIVCFLSIHLLLLINSLESSILSWWIYLKPLLESNVCCWKSFWKTI